MLRNLELDATVALEGLECVWCVVESGESRNEADSLANGVNTFRRLSALRVKT